MRRLLAGLTGLTVLALGCDSGRVTPSEPTPQPASEQEGKAPSGETVVQIDNQNFNDMNIYLLDEGNRVFPRRGERPLDGYARDPPCRGLE